MSNVNENMSLAQILSAKEKIVEKVTNFLKTEGIVTLKSAKQHSEIVQCIVAYKHIIQLATVIDAVKCKADNSPGCNKDIITTKTAIIGEIRGWIAEYNKLDTVKTISREDRLILFNEYGMYELLPVDEIERIRDAVFADVTVAKFSPEPWDLLKTVVIAGKYNTAALFDSTPVTSSNIPSGITLKMVEKYNTIDPKRSDAFLKDSPCCLRGDNSKISIYNATFEEIFKTKMRPCNQMKMIDSKQRSRVSPTYLSSFFEQETFIDAKTTEEFLDLIKQQLLRIFDSIFTPATDHDEIIPELQRRSYSSVVLVVSRIERILRKAKHRFHAAENAQTLAERFMYIKRAFNEALTGSNFSRIMFDPVMAACV